MDTRPDGLNMRAKNFAEYSQWLQAVQENIAHYCERVVENNSTFPEVSSGQQTVQSGQSGKKTATMYQDTVAELTVVPENAASSGIVICDANASLGTCTCDARKLLFMPPKGFIGQVLLRYSVKGGGRHYDREVEMSVIPVEEDSSSIDISTGTPSETVDVVLPSMSLSTRSLLDEMPSVPAGLSGVLQKQGGANYRI